MKLWDICLEKGLCRGGADWRRMVATGLVKVNDITVTDWQMQVNNGDVVRVGKKIAEFVVVTNVRVGDKVKTNFNYNERNFFTAYPITEGVVTAIDEKGTASVLVGSEVRTLHYTWLEEI